MSEQQCHGKQFDDKPCKLKVVKGELYCKRHMYFKSYTTEMMANLVKCNRCASMCVKTSSNQCPYNTELTRLKNLKQSQAKHKKPKCEGIIIDHKTGDDKRCSLYQLENSKYCGKHQYFADYTSDEIKNFKLCLGCNMKKPIREGYRRCDKCIGHSSDNNEKEKMKKESMLKCKVINCDHIAKFGAYCGKHRILQLREDAEKDGFKLCGGGNHSCMNRIKIDSERVYCDECMQKHRDEDKMRYRKEKQDAEEFNSEHDDIMKCIKCGKEFNVDDCVKDIHGNTSKKCKDCFKKQQDIENKRLERHRDWAKWYQEFIKNPVRVAKKKQWKIDNAEKLRGYWKKYREMLREKLGTDEYHLLMAEKMRSYWERNPEKREIRNDKSRKSVKERYDYYRDSSVLRQKEWSDKMTLEYCEKLFKSQCCYCGKKYVPNGYLLGIDRVDNTKGYCIDNCVACCDICNFMKRTHTKDNFIKMCMHIYCKLFDEKSNMYPDVFKGRKTIPTFEGYNSSANKRNIEMSLNPEDIIRIQNQPCYMCGHIDKKEDYNGIDRMNSNDSYQRNNCKACCATCNYLKNDLSIIEFISHIIKIVWYQDGSFVFQCDEISYNYHVDYMVSCGVEHSNIISVRDPYDRELFEEKVTDDTIQHMKDESSIHKAKTPEELREYNRIKKQESDARKREGLGVEEIKKQERIKKALQRGKTINKDGYTMKAKQPLSSTERSRLCRERKNKKYCNNLKNK